MTENGVNEPGHFGPAPEGDPLTDWQVAELREGTPVTVIWSGGNGPHDYEITVDGRGQRYVCAPGEDNERMRYYNPIRFDPLTRVWLRFPSVKAGD